ncbi:sugar transport protein MST1-like [Musa acuminata AAA Group]|uniref:sugar transport protein MST1-like n=1 Tax=Musa acuminata AAA Group TaxID=214697 RepID=UPI0031E3428D
MFRTVGFGSDAALMNAVILVVVSVTSVLVFTFLVDRCGRKLLFIVGGALMILCFSWGPLNWIIPTEVLPVEIRSAGQSIDVAANLCVTFVQRRSFLAMLCRFKHGTFAYFSAWVAIMTAFIVVFLSETKGVPLESIDDLWRCHWYWRRFLVDGSKQDMKPPQP